MNTTTITNLLELFGVVTVMDVHVYKIKTPTYSYGTKILNKDCFEDTGICLDTLKISNIKQSAAQKQFSIGLFNIPLVKIGKKIEIEIQDVLGRISTLEHFFGCKIDNNAQTISVNKDFANLLLLEGKTWIVDLQGNKQELWITIPCFLPKSALNINMQATGDAAVFDLSGEVYPVMWNNSSDLQYFIISAAPISGVTEVITK